MGNWNGLDIKRPYLMDAINEIPEEHVNGFNKWKLTLDNNDLKYYVKPTVKVYAGIGDRTEGIPDYVDNVQDYILYKKYCKINNIEYKKPCALDALEKALNKTNYMSLSQILFATETNTDK